MPCGRVNSVAEALDDPHALARRMMETVEHPTVGPLRLLGIPFKLESTPARVRRPPPTLGQHTAEILREELGPSEARIEALRARRVV